MVFNLSGGERDYGDNDTWKALRARTTLWYNWNEWLSSRTGVAVAENTPVFARQDLQQDISLKVVHGTLFTFGYRYASYTGDSEVNAWSGGLSVYTGPFITSWRYTRYYSEDKGDSYSHIVTLRMNDWQGEGNTQLWLSRGTGAYAYDWYSAHRKGTLKGVSLRRAQPLRDQLSLGISVGKQWYDTPVDRYQGVQTIADISWHF